MPPNTLAYKWLHHALHGTKRYENRLTFHKLTWTPPPPPPKWNLRYAIEPDNVGKLYIYLYNKY